MKRAWKFLCLALFVLLQGYLFLVKDFQVLDHPAHSAEVPVPLMGETRDVEQRFRTGGPLNRVDILMGNYQVKPKDGLLQLEILKDKETLFFKRYPADRVEDNKFYRFAVTAKKTIGAGEYTLRLKYLQKNKKDRLAVWSSKENKYPYGDFLVNGKPKPGDLTFRIYYRGTIWSQRGHLLAKIPSAWGGPVWFSLSLIVLLLLLNLTAYFFINKL